MTTKTYETLLTLIQGLKDRIFVVEEEHEARLCSLETRVNDLFSFIDVQSVRFTNRMDSMTKEDSRLFTRFCDLERRIAELEHSIKSGGVK